MTFAQRLRQLAKLVGYDPTLDQGRLVYHKGVGVTHVPGGECEWCRLLEGYWSKE